MPDLNTRKQERSTARVSCVPAQTDLAPQPEAHPAHLLLNLATCCCPSRSAQVNAFVVPGGKVVVYTGALPVSVPFERMAVRLQFAIACTGWQGGGVPRCADEPCMHVQWSPCQSRNDNSYGTLLAA